MITTEAEGTAATAYAHAARRAGEVAAAGGQSYPGQPSFLRTEYVASLADELRALAGHAPAGPTAAEAVRRLREEADRLRIEAEAAGDTPRGGGLREQMLARSAAALLVEAVCS